MVETDDCAAECAAVAVERAAVLVDDLREGEAREEGEREVCDDVSMVLDVRR